MVVSRCTCCPDGSKSIWGCNPCLFPAIPVRARESEIPRPGTRSGNSISRRVGVWISPRSYWKRIESIYSFQSATIHHYFIAWETKEFAELFRFLFRSVLGQSSTSPAWWVSLSPVSYLSLVSHFILRPFTLH